LQGTEKMLLVEALGIAESGLEHGKGVGEMGGGVVAACRDVEGDIEISGPELVDVGGDGFERLMVVRSSTSPKRRPATVSPTRK